jgi:UDP-glucose 4-epimerase
VLYVIETDKKVSGRYFMVVTGGPRPGDPVSDIAAPAFKKKRLGWRPDHDTLEEIVGSALSWEASLSRRNLQ